MFILLFFKLLMSASYCPKDIGTILNTSSLFQINLLRILSTTGTTSDSTKEVLTEIINTLTLDIKSNMPAIVTISDQLGLSESLKDITTFSNFPLVKLSYINKQIESNPNLFRLPLLLKPDTTIPLAYDSKVSILMLIPVLRHLLINEINNKNISLEELLPAEQIANILDRSNFLNNPEIIPYLAIHFNLTDKFDNKEQLHHDLKMYLMQFMWNKKKPFPLEINDVAFKFLNYIYRLEVEETAKMEDFICKSIPRGVCDVPSIYDYITSSKDLLAAAFKVDLGLYTYHPKDRPLHKLIIPLFRWILAGHIESNKIDIINLDLAPTFSLGEIREVLDLSRPLQNGPKQHAIILYLTQYFDLISKFTHSELLQRKIDLYMLDLSIQKVFDVENITNTNDFAQNLQKTLKNLNSVSPRNLLTSSLSVNYPSLTSNVSKDEISKLNISDKTFLSLALGIKYPYAYHFDDSRFNRKNGSLDDYILNNLRWHVIHFMSKNNLDSLKFFYLRKAKVYTTITHALKLLDYTSEVIDFDLENISRCLFPLIRDEPTQRTTENYIKRLKFFRKYTAITRTRNVLDPYFKITPETAADDKLTIIMMAISIDFFDDFTNGDKLREELYQYLETLYFFIDT